ncbi:MAG TPA: hypothetical protein VF495_21755 [Phenylobacterium sp.]|jgi:hypothetical protein
MRRPSSDTLKLGAPLVLLGAACLSGWIGLALVLSGGRLLWTDLSVIALGNLGLTAIVGLLVWVLTDQTSGQRRIDA